MKKEIIHEELSGEIIGATMDVLHDLTPGTLTMEAGGAADQTEPDVF